MVEPVQKLEEFFAQYKLLKYKKNEVIERPGNVVQFVYYIAQGFVKQSAFSEEGEELILNIFPAHSYFYYIFTAPDKTYAYYFMALTAVTAFRAPKTEVMDYLNTHPAVTASLHKRSHFTMDSIYARMETLVFGNTRVKVWSVLTMCAARFGNPITVPLTHKDIASLCGITRETASLELSKLKKERKISFDNRYIHLHLPKYV